LEFYQEEVFMEAKANPYAAYIPSEDVVAREIEGELIIVPLVTGMGDMEDDLFTLNETGRAIWDRLDGKKNLKELIAELRDEFEDEAGKMEQDVVGLTSELLKRKMLVEVHKS
jgi:hypothetical protein